MLWPLGLTIGVWLLASLIIGRLYPEAIQRFTVQPNQFAQEERYIGNNIAMTRLAFGLDDWEDDRPFRGEEVLSRAGHRERGGTPSATPGCGTTGRSATPLDQLQRIRRYYDFHDVDTDRYDIDDVQRQVMLSARELDLDQNPGAAGFVNQRIVYTHGIGAAMVPVNEVANEGQPRLFIRNLPPVSAPRRARRSPSRASTSASAIRRTSWSALARTSSTTRPARATKPERAGNVDALDAGRPASASTRR